MCAAKIRKRIHPPPVGIATCFSMFGFLFIAAGSFLVLLAFGEFIIDPVNLANLGGALSTLIFVLILLLIGYWSMKHSHEGASGRIEFETASTTTTARAVKRERKQKTGEYGRRSYSYWVSVKFQPIQAGIETRDLILRANVRKKIHDTLEPGSPLKVRYANSNPCMALLEGETRHIERSINPTVLLLYWILANVLGGAVGFFIPTSLAVPDLFLFGAIVGFFIAEAQWTVMVRYVPIPNWMWVSASIVGWAAYIGLDLGPYGLIGGTFLGVVQWLILRQRLVGAELWVPFTVMGNLVGLFIFDFLAPFTPDIISGGFSQLAYGGATGIALYIIASRSLEAPAFDRSIKFAQRPTELAAELKAPSAVGLGIGREEMKLKSSGELISETPDEIIIKQTLQSLVSQGEGFAILGSGNTYIQALYETGEEFIMEYQGGSLDEHFACVSYIRLANVVRAFTMFLNADDRLITEFSWEWMEL